MTEEEVDGSGEGQGRVGRLRDTRQAPCVLNPPNVAVSGSLFEQQSCIARESVSLASVVPRWPLPTRRSTRRPGATYRIYIACVVVTRNVGDLIRRLLTVYEP